MAEENKAMELHGEESEKKKYISDVLDIDKLIEKIVEFMQKSLKNGIRTEHR